MICCISSFHCVFADGLLFAYRWLRFSWALYCCLLITSQSMSECLEARMTRGKWQDRLKSVEQRASSFQSSPLSCPYKPRLSRPWQPSSVWRLFPRQNTAIAFTQHIKQVETEAVAYLFKWGITLLFLKCLALIMFLSGRAFIFAGEGRQWCWTEDFPSDQLQWTLALLQVPATHDDMCKSVLGKYLKESNLLQNFCMHFEALLLVNERSLSLQHSQTVSDALLWGHSGGGRLQTLLWLRVR